MRLAISILLTVLAFLAPRGGHACGGFFTVDDPDLPRPVFLAGVQVLFLAGAGEVETHMQVQYDGEASEFAWVIPVPAIPEIALGTDDAFFHLAAQTAPTFRVEGNLDDCPVCEDCGGDSDGDADGDIDGGGDRVDIVDRGVVGPYETVTLSSGDADELADWLVANGYAVPDIARPIIAAYVAQGMFFVGLKLTKEATVGDLRPVVLRMTGAAIEPCVPLRLAAIAAVADMPVSAWLAGDARAFSTNYVDVELDDLGLYHGGDETYEALVARAADEVGGRAFVTEYAGSSAAARAAMSPDRFDLDLLRGIDDPVEFLNEMVRQGFVESRVVLELLEEFIPRPASIPDDVDDATFYECLDCVDEYYYYDDACEACYEADVAGQPFDPVAFADALEENVVAPLRDLDAKLAVRPYLTALRSTISPGEMTEDPFFDFRDDLPDVAADRPGSSTRHCQGSILPADDWSEGSTPGGLETTWLGVGPGGIPPGLPAVHRAFERTVDGDTVLVDNTVDIQALTPEVEVPEAISLNDDLECECGRSDGRVPGGDADADSDGDGDGDADGGSAAEGGGCSCRTGGGGSPAIVLLLPLALVLRRRRPI